MSAMLRTELRAAGFVIFRQLNDGNEYLLLQTSYGTHHWTPPKGHVDPGESDLETAFRETSEESGLKKTDLKVLDYQAELKYNVRSKPKTVVYWLAELINKQATVKLSNEHQAFKWAPLNEAIQLAKYKDLQELLKVCESFITEI